MGLTLSDKEHAFVTARSSGRTIKYSYEEAGYPKNAWYGIDKDRRNELENEALRIKRHRSEDARTILDEAGAKFATELVKLLDSDDENIKFKAAREGLLYILKTENDGKKTAWAEFLNAAQQENAAE